MKKYIIISIAIICILMTSCKKDKSSASSTQQGSIYGIVTDFASGDYVRHANVQLRPSGETTQTGYNGQYEFKNIEDGDYTIVVRKAEYSDLIDDYVISVRDGRRMRRDVQIQKLPQMLQIVDNNQHPLPELDFGSYAGVSQKSFNLFNGGLVNLDFTITKTANWITQINPSFGTVNKGNMVTVSVIINRNLLSDGDNVTTIVVSTNAGGVELPIKARKVGGSINDLVIEVPGTNLMVQRADLGCYDWYSANAYCQSSNVANYNDWRLPTIDELEILYNHREFIGGFGGDKYWSTTKYSYNGEYKYYSFDGSGWGNVGIDSPSESHYVRAIRTITGGGGNATTWSDNFEGGSLSNWTLIDADGDGLKWQITNPQSDNIGDAHSGWYCASSWSWSNIAYDPDNYMISPLCSNATNIQYYVATNIGYPDHYAVMASSTGTNINNFSIVFEETVPVSNHGGCNSKTTITNNYSTRDMSSWTERNINLPAGTKYVAFRHYNSYDMNYIFIDDVTITMGQ